MHAGVDIPAQPQPAPFHYAQNNGVIALVTDEAWMKIADFSAFIRSPRGQLIRPRFPVVPGVIFTFADYPPAIEVTTGDRKLYERIRAHYTGIGHEFLNRDFGLYVPFSNGMERCEEGDARAYELTFRTTPEEFLAAFPGFKP